jgi:hypothetical protein
MLSFLAGLLHAISRETAAAAAAAAAAVCVSSLVRRAKLYACLLWEARLCARNKATWQAGKAGGMQQQRRQPSKLFKTCGCHGMML